MLGLVGLINTVLSFWIWFEYLTDYRNNTDFWYA